MDLHIVIVLQTEFHPYERINVPHLSHSHKTYCYVQGERVAYCLIVFLQEQKSARLFCSSSQNVSYFGMKDGAREVLLFENEVSPEASCV